MKLIVDGAHPLFEHVSVNLCCRQIGVSQHHLNCAQVGTTLQQVRRKGVTKHVRAERRRNAGLTRVALEYLPEANARETHSSTARVHEEARATPSPEQHRT